MSGPPEFLQRSTSGSVHSETPSPELTEYLLRLAGRNGELAQPMKIDPKKKEPVVSSPQSHWAGASFEKSPDPGDLPLPSFLGRK